MGNIPALLDRVPRSAQLFFTVVGALYVTATALSFLHFLANNFIFGGTNLRKYGKKGSWAVVTGASDGIGKEFATQLAAKGFNLVLVSRTKSKLETLARDLKNMRLGSGLQTKILAMDFARDDDADYERLRELLSGLDVGILVNNVGQSHSIPVPFLETEKNELQGIITVNCVGTLKTTQVVAPLMVQRQKGLILTIGSFAGWTPTPYLATYSGSKAFLQYWSSALAAELKPQGVDVQFVVSYLVTTALSKIRRTSLMIPNPKQFARSSLGKVGLDNTQRIAYTYTPYWTHALFQRLIDGTVGFGSKLTIWVNLEMHLGIRIRALKKAAREAKKA